MAHARRKRRALEDNQSPSFSSSMRRKKLAGSGIDEIGTYLDLGENYDKIEMSPDSY